MQSIGSFFTDQDKARGKHHALFFLLVLAAVLAGFLLTTLWFGGAHIGAVQAGTIYGGALIVVASGELVLRAGGLVAIPARLLAAIVTGATFTSLAVLLGALWTGLPAGQVFVGWAVFVIAALVATRDRISWQSQSGDLADCAVVAILAVVVAFWCRHVAAAMPTLLATGILPAWIDYYIHGAVIAEFGSELAAGHGAIDLAGQPLPLAHYGGYMIAAATAALTDLPGLGLAAAVLLPLGLLLAVLGSYALAVTLGGPPAGVLAIAFLALLPDASFYGLANGLFGFHWLLFTSPGSGYGLAAAAVALMLACHWLRDRSKYALALAALLVASEFQLRAQFLVILAPAFVAILLCDTAVVRRNARLLLWLIVGAAVVTAILLLAVPPLRFFWLDHSAIVRFLAFAHEKSAPTAYDGLNAHMIASLGGSAALALGTPLLLPAMLGVFVVLYPAVLAAWVRRAGWQISDLVPLLLLAVYLAVIVLAPVATNTGGMELQHRPFVLLYQVIAIWTAAYLCRLTFSEAAAANSVRAMVALATIVAASILVGLFTKFEPAQPKFGWGKGFFRVPIAAGMFDAAAFVRRSAQPGDIMVVAPADPKATLIDHAIEMVSLTDLPCYLARPGIHKLNGARNNRIALDRLARLDRIEKANDASTAFTLLRQIGVTWYVHIGADVPAFDPNKARAVFANGNAAVYRIARDPL
jgi:hypothetical protein